MSPEGYRCAGRPHNIKKGLLPIEWVIFRNSDVMAVFDDDTLADR
jgi:hypothetical protein